MSSVASSVRINVGSNDSVLKGILRNNVGNTTKDKMADPTILDPSRQTHQQRQHGHPVSGHPPGMMPIPPGVIPFGVMPSSAYMMPPYYNCAPYTGNWYNYSRVHPDKQTVGNGNTGGSPFGNIFVGSCHDSSCGGSSGSKETSSSSGTSCATLLFAGSSRLADLFIGLCGPSTGTCNGVGSHQSSSTQATLSTPQELVEKVDILFVGLSRLADLFIGLCGPSTGTCNGVGSHQSSSTQATLSTPQELVEKVDMLYTLITPKDTSGENFTPLKSYQAKEETATTPQESAVDSMGFPLASSNGKLSEALSWESDFSSTNLFAGENVCGLTSPVSVTASLGTRGCAWCGLGGSNTKAAKKTIMVCSACESTCYCSSECHSKDWINGHAMMDNW